MGASSEDEADRLRRVISGLLQNMGKDDLERVLAVAQRIRARRDVPDPPRSAPELFRGREGGETVVEFIARVYGPWLTGEFTRADLARLDRKCEKALRDWEYRHGKVPESKLNLPTLKARNSRLIAAGVEREVDPLRRQGLRNIAANRRYKKRSAT